MNEIVTNPELKCFASADDMARAGADAIVAALAQGVATRGEASLVAAGGRTPAAIYDKLCHVDVPWRQVTVLPGDERWVGADHGASNESMIRRTLLRDRARDLNMVGLRNDAASNSAGLGDIAQRVAALPRPFDVVMLGMGNDGHTASLFPGAQGLEAALDPDGDADVAAITPDPLPAEAPFARITLTVRALLDARQIMLFVQGAQKKAVLDQALAGADAQAMPVRAILRQDRTPVSIYYAA
ncbi:MAG: 6-phosphogluconolactonase [Sphingomonadales bacterium]